MRQTYILVSQSVKGCSKLLWRRRDQFEEEGEEAHITKAVHEPSAGDKYHHIKNILQMYNTPTFIIQ